MQNARRCGMLSNNALQPTCETHAAERGRWASRNAYYSTTLVTNLKPADWLDGNGTPITTGPWERNIGFWTGIGESLPMDRLQKLTGRSSRRYGSSLPVAGKYPRGIACRLTSVSSSHATRARLAKAMHLCSHSFRGIGPLRARDEAHLDHHRN